MLIPEEFHKPVAILFLILAILCGFIGALEGQVHVPLWDPRERVDRVLIQLAQLDLCGPGDECNPYRNTHPHDIPGCGTPLAAAKSDGKLAPCKCTVMVSKIQEPLTAKCWEDAGYFIPPDVDNDAALRNVIPWNDPPKKVLDCLEQVPDHCSIIAGVYPGYPMRTYGVKLNEICQTSCNPQNCVACQDGACKSHDESDDY